MKLLLLRRSRIFYFLFSANAKARTFRCELRAALERDFVVFRIFVSVGYGDLDTD
jgi:hypothetical protein